MSELRAIFLNDEWVKVRHCQGCIGCFQDEYEDLLCGALGVVVPASGIIPSCPLPKWDDVCWHGVDDRPKKDAALQLRYTHKKEKRYFYGVYQDERFRDAQGVKIIESIFPDFEWRYLTPGGKNE